MNKCSDRSAGPEGCNSPVFWIIKAADKRMASCGRHLNRVCLQMLETGVEYMTVGILE